MTFRDWPPPREHTLKRTGKPTFKKPKKPRNHGGGPFTDPTDIAGLQLWMDGQDLSTMWQDTAKTIAVTGDFDPIKAWVDKSANAFDYLENTNPPVYRLSGINGTAAPKFDESDFLVGPHSTNLQFGTGALTFMGVVNFFTLRVNTNANVIFSKGGGNYEFIDYDVAAPSSQLTTLQGFDDTKVETTANTVANVPYLYGFTRAAAAGACQYYRDGVAKDSYTDTGNTSVDATVTTIGRTTAGTLNLTMHGWIGDLVLYDSELGTADLNRLVTFFKARWGIT